MGQITISLKHRGRMIYLFWCPGGRSGHENSDCGLRGLWCLECGLCAYTATRTGNIHLNSSLECVHHSL